MNETYEKILQASYKLLAQYGYDNTSLNMIAKSVNISKPSLYYYFSSKEELFNEVFNQVIDQMKFETLHDLTKFTKENFEDKLLEIGLKEIDSIMSDNYFSSSLKEMVIYSTRNPNVNNMFMEVISSYIEGFHKLLKHGIDIGALPENMDIDLQAQILAMTIDSITNFISYGVDFDFKKIWMEIVKTVCINMQYTKKVE